MDKGHLTTSKMKDDLSNKFLTAIKSSPMRGIAAGSQLKMSECQTKAGNQECFENLKKPENLKTSKT